MCVSTHSRPKAAGQARQLQGRRYMFQHTAARRRLATMSLICQIHTWFQHTAARRRLGPQNGCGCMTERFNTQPPEGGWLGCYAGQDCAFVSTHSRPKAAGINQHRQYPQRYVSTHSRPKAAGTECLHIIVMVAVSTHSRPKAAGKRCGAALNCWSVSTHSRPKAAGASLKSLAPSGFAALISLSSQEKREREYNTALSVTPAFAIS